MPYVILKYKPGRGLECLARDLADKLPEIVALALTIPDRKRDEGQVTPEDIIVSCEEGGPADVNSQHFVIFIFAHEFPERKANLEERKDAITKDVRRFLNDPNHHLPGFVWVFLGPTAFGRL